MQDEWHCQLVLVSKSLRLLPLFAFKGLDILKKAKKERPEGFVTWVIIPKGLPRIRISMGVSIGIITCCSIVVWALGGLPLDVRPNETK